VSDVCERCGEPTVAASERFCKECRKDVLAELKEAGFLTPTPYRRSRRTAEQRENVYETKHGTGHG
jgi:hypothetical protein